MENGFSKAFVNYFNFKLFSRLLVASQSGYMYVYSIPLDGGECQLIKKHGELVLSHPKPRLSNFIFRFEKRREGSERKTSVPTTTAADPR